ncbi:helix-turn-helix transcriptional regulator [Brachybacterium sp. AOP3-A1-3]|uniref:helix-turn-helix transcriptional regulator n=1 Tax=Brachybacterium sp. AOP3-A1-3 TaxID=3457699 RepID=UPI00403362B0
MSSSPSPHPVLGRRFVPLSEVAEMFSISSSQAYALVRSGDLRAIQIGGRRQWRVELSEIEAYIERAHVAARNHVDSEGTST